MKFIVSSTSLLSHLQSISRVIGSKSTMPILDNFLLKVEDGKLTVTASDLETTLVTSLDLEQTEGEGLIAISAKMLLDILKEFSEQPLTFSINEKTLEVSLKSSLGVYNLVGQSGSEYPLLPELEEESNTFSIESSQLANGINKTIFATATDDLRPTMTGILFDIKNESLIFVATDAHRLVRFMNKTVKSDKELSFILPQKPANILKGILAKENCVVKVDFDEKNIVFTLSNYKMVCRQIEGRFPAYDKVIPQNNTIKAVIDKSSFVNSLKRVSIFSNQGNNQIKLNLNDNELTISAQDIDFSTSAEEKISCQYSEEAFCIGFKSPFLIEMVNSIDSSEVVMEFSDKSRPGLIIPLDQEENEDVLMLLMPMLLND